MEPTLHTIWDPKSLVWLDGPLPPAGEGRHLLVWLQPDFDGPPNIAVLQSHSVPNGAAKHFEWCVRELNGATEEVVSRIVAWAWLQWPVHTTVS